MIKRQKAIKIIADTIDNDCKVISCLGYISRDLYHLVEYQNRVNCFFNLGAMGSCLPFGLGLALQLEEKRILVLEGDGSILMNLGGLVTFHRYNPGNMTLFIIDNKQYESTGGQPSQPINFSLIKLCKSIGLKSIKIGSAKALSKVLLKLRNKSEKYDVVIIDTMSDAISPRIKLKPIEISEIFKANLRN